MIETMNGGDRSVPMNTQESTTKPIRVQLSLRAIRLKNVAGFLKGTSDPYAVITLLPSDAHSEAEVLGKTEVIKNCLNPTWTRAFYLDYTFGVPQHLNIGVYDEVRKSKDKIMGSATFEMGEILGSNGNVKARCLKSGGVVYARMSKASDVQEKLALTLSARELKNVESKLLGGKSDPFFELARRDDGPAGGYWRPVLRSAHLKNNLNPDWEPVTVDLDLLCDGDQARPIQMTVFDHEKSGKHRFLGAVETSVKGLMDACFRSFPLPLQQIKGKDKGFINVRNAHIISPGRGSTSTAPTRSRDQGISTSFTPPPQPTPPPQSKPQRPTFVDYLSGACELKAYFAIDFTGSNGDPRIPGTLHHIHTDKTQLNDYEKAITAIGSIIAKYDSDQKFPVWGFGAKLDGVVRHFFQLGPEEEVNGIHGVLKVYRKLFRSPMVMSGPTCFDEVIDRAAFLADVSQAKATEVGKQCYSILIILTDGCVSNLEQTRQSILQASQAPLSIVIVGIGDADFSSMQFLDDFGESQLEIRDITQFVEFKQHAKSKNSLTKSTLEEITNQLVDYFYERGILPLPLQNASHVEEESYDATRDVDLDLRQNGEDGEITVVGGGGYCIDDEYESGVAYLREISFRP